MLKSWFQWSSAAWEGMARKDPFYAICTDPAKKARWEPEEFFTSGKHEIGVVFHRLTELGLSAPDQETALDFGCGLGRLSRALSDRFCHVVGVDVSPTMVREAIKWNTAYGERLSFVVNERPDLQVLGNVRFSFVYSSVVIQHIPRPTSLQYVRELALILKPGGIFVFQVPTLHRASITRRFRGWLRLRERLARLHLQRFDYFMQMNVLPQKIVEATVGAAGCEILDVVTTNSTWRNFNGNLKFISERDSGEYVSKQFTVRRILG